MDSNMGISPIEDSRQRKVTKKSSKNFWIVNRLGPMLICTERYVVVEFVTAQRNLQFMDGSRWLHIHIAHSQKVILKMLPLSLFVHSIESSINAIHCVIEEEQRLLPYLYMHLGLVLEPLGLFIFIEVNRIICDERVGILDLRFENEFYTLYQLIDDNYKKDCFKSLVWRNRNNEDNIQDMCMVCLQEFEDDDGELHQIKPCNHVFHHGCITRWFSNRFLCPICKMRPSSKSLSFIGHLIVPE